MVLSVDATAGAFKSMLASELSTVVNATRCWLRRCTKAALKAANGEELPKWVPSQEGVFRAS